jgi:hypothetical protein
VNIVIAGSEKKNKTQQEMVKNGNNVDIINKHTKASLQKTVLDLVECLYKVTKTSTTNQCKGSFDAIYSSKK